MKIPSRFSSFLLLLFALLPPGSGFAQQIKVSPDEGSLASILEDGRLSVTFPTPMVDIDCLGEGPCPLVFDPPLEVEWTWTSQHEGYLIRPADLGLNYMRQIMYRAKLRGGLRDLADRPVGPDSWGVQFRDDQFAVSALEFLNAPVIYDDPPTEGEEELEDAEIIPDWRIRRRGDNHPLPSLPRVRIEFSHNVDVREAQKRIVFLDSSNGEVFPVEAALEGVLEPRPQGWMLVEPVKPLPPGRIYYLVINREWDGRALPRQLIIPAGKTLPFEIGKIVGLNQPGDGAFIRIEASKEFAAAGFKRAEMRISPEVADLKIEHDPRGGQVMRLAGSFDTGMTYRVTLKAGIASADGTVLAEDTTWTVRFRKKRPAVIVRAPFFFQRNPANGVRVPFTQVNTGPLKWKIISVPPKELEGLRSRLREFGEFQWEGNKVARHPVTGDYLVKETQVFTENRSREDGVLGEGDFPASGDDKEIAREIRWTPPWKGPGTYLVEIYGRDSAGRTVGNRALVSCGDWIITGVRDDARYTVRVARMSDGLPAAQVRVEIVFASRTVLGKNDELVKQEPVTQVATTDANGEAHFDASEEGWGMPESIFAGEPGGQSFQPADQFEFETGNFGNEWEPDACGIIVTNRNLYRPGDTVSMKGIERHLSDGKLDLHPSQEIEWNIFTDVEDKEDPTLIHSGTATLSKSGSWEATWEIPRTMLGKLSIEAGGDFKGKTEITVADFRPLAFSVKVDADDSHGETATAEVSSSFFHGAPNANATVRWKAVWVIHDELSEDPMEGDLGEERIDTSHGDPSGGDHFTVNDPHSPSSRTRGVSSYVLAKNAKAGWDTGHGTGQALQVSRSVVRCGLERLDDRGRATLSTKSPFQRGMYRRAEVKWMVDVVSESAAQTVRGGAEARVQFAEKILGVSMGRTDEGLSLSVASFDKDNKPAPGLTAKAEVYHLTVKTVKEQIAGNIQRYRNFPEFTKVWEGELVTPASRSIQVKDPGEYVAKVTAPGQPLVPTVSALALEAGEGEAEVPVESDTKLAIRLDKKSYRPGETANLAIESPVQGIATIMVASGRVLARHMVEIRGNAQVVPLQVQPSFAPNAYVLVHLVKAAGADGAPAERFGSCEIKVEPAQPLQAVMELAAEQAEPAGIVSGNVLVTKGGRPVPNAEVLIFAADDAILELGKWQMPDFKAAFFPPRRLGVSMYGADLKRYAAAVTEGNPSLEEKGFVLGASALLKGTFYSDPFPRAYRNFNFWKPMERTDQVGRVTFSFTAPDVLTRCRLVAVVQSGAADFATATRTLHLAKRLQVEPHYPDFVRVGDEVRLRATVQQDYADSDEIEVRLERLGSAMKADDVAPRRLVLKRAERKVVEFQAKVPGGYSRARVLLVAKSLAGPFTATEDHTLQVRPGVIERSETKTGLLTGAEFHAGAAREAPWNDGNCDVIISNSSYLSKLAGLPELIEARGSLEKDSTRILAATVLAESLAFFPKTPEDEKKFRASLEERLRSFAQSITEDGRVPCWEGSAAGNDHVSLQAAWAILSARHHKYEIREDLISHYKEILELCMEKKGPFENACADDRAFAYMIAAYARELEEKEAAAEVPPIFEEEEEQGDDEAVDLPVVPKKDDAQDDEGDAEGNEEGDEMENEEAAEMELAEEIASDKGLTDEGKAWLALGLFAGKQLPKLRDQLLAEIEGPPTDNSFNPATFSSAKRRAAVRLLAHCKINYTNWNEGKRNAEKKRLDEMIRASASLSTQESLWVLMLLNAMTGQEHGSNLRADAVTPGRAVGSPNSRSVGWLQVPLAEFGSRFPHAFRPSIRGSFMLRATYPVSEDDKGLANRGLNLTREARLLTPEGNRNGSAEAPWKLGDHVLITFAVDAETPLNYLQLEDLIPACFETVNPDLPMIREHFNLPVELGVHTLELAHSEFRSDRTVLYFDKFPRGRNLYGVLARVAVPGVFRWPRTQVRPMYDSRFGAVSEGSIVHVVE